MNDSKRFDTVALFGLPVTNVTMDEALVRIDQCIRSGHSHQVATANLDFARHSLGDVHLQRILCDCTLVLADGAPMLWASRLLGTPLRERVTGVDLVPQLAKLSAERGYRIYLLGSNDYSAATAAQMLRTRFPGTRIVGRYSPPLQPLHRMDHEDLLSRIAAAKPDILLVAFGNPKQEFWMHEHRARLNVPVMIGIGGALDMIAGVLKRAPRWVQSCHLEWFYRLVQEPGRLLPRYLHDAYAFLQHLPFVLLASRLQPESQCRGELHTYVQGDLRFVKTPTNLSGELCAMLQQEARAAAAERQTLILDMSATTRIEADGLGSLLNARRLVHATGRFLWLSGVSMPVRRVLQSCAVLKLFRIAPSVVEAARLAPLTNLDAEWRALEALAKPYFFPASALSSIKVVNG